ncbi:CapA family protein [Patescibacteria group bacterium]|nr:CapA family protein [Patescibacteria group bacterium]
MIKHKTIIIILFCLAFIFLLLGFSLAYYNKTLFLPTDTSLVPEDHKADNFWPESTPTSTIDLEQALATSSPVELIFVGDIMLARHVDFLGKQAKNEEYPFLKIKDFLTSADFTVGNLEGPIIKNYFTVPNNTVRFSFAPNKAEVLAKAGFDYLSQANNHTNDPYLGAETETKEYLNKNNILGFGQNKNSGQDKAVRISKDGQEINLFGLYDFGGDFDEAKALDNISQQVEENVLDIVFVHWGLEYNTKHANSQEILAHKLIDSGVDLIIGHHPHVVQDIEQYKNKYIFYSLGNFIFDQYFSVNTQQGLALKLILDDTENKIELYPVDIKLAQASLMLDVDKNKFLENLNKNSKLDFKLTEYLPLSFD